MGGQRRLARGPGTDVRSFLFRVSRGAGFGFVGRGGVWSASRAAPSRFAPKRARTEALDATMRAIGGAGYSPSVANVRVARRPRRAAPDAFVLLRPI